MYFRSMKIAFHTLGCKLNYSETSFIANNLKNDGMEITNFSELSDVYVINTCSVTENAMNMLRNTHVHHELDAVLLSH